MFELFLGGLDATTATQPLLRSVKKDNIICLASYGPSAPQSLVSSYNSNLLNFIIVNDAIDMEGILSKAEKKGFQPMNQEAKMFVLTLNDFFNSNNIVPTNSFPIAEGGVSIELNYDNIYYNFEIANDGEASFYKEEVNQIPEGWDYNYAGLINRLKTEFNG